MKDDKMRHAFFYIALIANSLAFLSLIALTRSILDLQQRPQRSQIRQLILFATISKILITLTGSIAAISIFLLPNEVAYGNPLALCVLRVVCFFYGCKTLHLSWTKAQHPPVLLHDGQPVDMLSIRNILEYIWCLATEMRYHSFDIAVHQRDRPEHQVASMSRPIAAAFLVGILAYFLPMLTELK